jgi:hypothetical protein
MQMYSAPISSCQQTAPSYTLQKKYTRSKGDQNINVRIPFLKKQATGQGIAIKLTTDDGNCDIMKTWRIRRNYLEMR